MSDYIHIVDVTNKKYAYIGKAYETIPYLKAIYNMKEETVICLFGDESCGWIEDKVIEKGYEEVELYEIFGNTDNFRDIDISKDDFWLLYELIQGEYMNVKRFRKRFDKLFKNRKINMLGMEEEEEE